MRNMYNTDSIIHLLTKFMLLFYTIERIALAQKFSLFRTIIVWSVSLHTNPTYVLKKKNNFKDGFKEWFGFTAI
jgi:hypothetical protein